MTRRGKNSRIVYTTVAIGLIGASTGRANLVINPTFTSTFVTDFGANAPAAENAWIAAAQVYEANFDNNIQININVTAETGILSGSTHQTNHFGWTTLRNALVANTEKSADDTTALNGSIPSADPNAGSTNWYVSRAESKALGLLASDSSTDGTTYFGPQNSYTFSGPVSAGTYDFEGVALHEIAEVMGRSGGGSTQPTLLDAFSYSAANTRSITGGSNAYFSIDAGTTLIKEFNDPSNGGDARDWASLTPYVSDAYNAFAFGGRSLPFSATDLRVMNVLGYDIHDTWDGTTNGNWDSTTQNFNDGTAPFSSGVGVTFADTAYNGSAVQNTGPITIQSVGVSPSGVVFTNSTVSYRFVTSGSVGIGGSGSVTIQGGGAVAFSSPNTYTGGTFITHGKLNAAAGSLPSGEPVTIGSAGTLAIGDGTTAAVGTLSTGAQTWTAGGDLAVKINGDGTSDLDQVVGSVTLTGTGTFTITLEPGTASINRSGDYEIATFSSLSGYTGTPPTGSGVDPGGQFALNTSGLSGIPSGDFSLSLESVNGGDALYVDLSNYSATPEATTALLSLSAAAAQCCWPGVGGTLAISDKEYATASVPAIFPDSPVNLSLP